MYTYIHIYSAPSPPFGTTRFLVELWYTVPQTDLNMFLGPPVVGINIQCWQIGCPARQESRFGFISGSGIAKAALFQVQGLDRMVRV